MILGVISIVGFGMTLRCLDIKDCGTVISSDNSYEQRYDLLVRDFNVAIHDLELNGLVMPAITILDNNESATTVNPPSLIRCYRKWKKEWG